MFTKSLDQILAPMTTIRNQLATYAKQQRELASRNRDKAATLVGEAVGAESLAAVADNHIDKFDLLNGAFDAEQKPSS